MKMYFLFFDGKSKEIIDDPIPQNGLQIWLDSTDKSSIGFTNDDDNINDDILSDDDIIQDMEQDININNENNSLLSNISSMNSNNNNRNRNRKRNVNQIDNDDEIEDDNDQ